MDMFLKKWFSSIRSFPRFPSNYFSFMDIKILAVGKVRDRAILQKIEEYAERVRHDAKLEIVEVKDSDPEHEGAKIAEHCRRERARIFALDERGKLFTSDGFARHLSAIPEKIIFVIGGPFGLSEQVKKASAGMVALSPMTFTHEMARLLLVEQIYRAISIIKNRKYHK
jgi:23S rRNA (pseudouridine1915-N3)-methyltransferase